MVNLTFAQTTVYVSDWKRLGLTDDDSQALEALLLANPRAGAVVPGAGGVRKVRFAPPSWRTGKRGAARVIYAYFVAAEVVYLLLAYGKNEQANFTPREKKQVAALAKRIADATRPEEDNL